MARPVSSEGFTVDIGEALAEGDGAAQTHCGQLLGVTKGPSLPIGAQTALWIRARGDTSRQPTYLLTEIRARENSFVTVSPTESINYCC